MKKTLLCLMMALMLTFSAAAETADPQAEIDALNARIAELEATVADLQAQLAQYEPTYDPEADVITFNGGSVKLADAVEKYNEMAAMYETFGMSEDEYAEDVKSDVLTNMAEDAVLTLKAQQLGVYDSSEEELASAEAEAQESFEATIAYYITYFLDDDTSEEEAREQTIQYLAEEGLTYETMLADTIDTMWRDRLYDAVTADVTVTDQDIHDLYESGLASAKETYAEDPSMFEYDYASGEIIFYCLDGYREVEYLLLPCTDEEFSAGDIDAIAANVPERYADAIDRANSGESLIALAEELSLYDYGVLPMCDASELADETFCTAAMALEMGQVSEPVACAEGVWLIRYTQDITPGDVPFDSLKDVLTESAVDSSRMDYYYELVDQWLEEANIVTHPELIP